ncbi:MAG: hypothetical protein V4628_11590 [Pseudomonadota bacterium]
MNKTYMTWGAIGSILLILLVTGLSTFGVNDSGNRTVVQLPSGKIFVKFEPGVYFDWFGRSTVYSDVITYEFDEKAVAEGEPDTSIGVRYQDGGTGSVYGTVRVVLPRNEEAMLKIHKEFKDERGITENLVEKVVRESLNLTAGLMTSEEAYAEKRNQYIEWAEDQISRGKYLTNLVPRTQIVEPAEIGANGQTIRAAVTRIQNIPEIRVVNGTPGRGESQFLEYGMDVSGLQLIDWGFETKTLAQIQEKRAANMAIITSQANAAKANQERLQAIAEGEKNVATAQYEQEVEKARQIVIAQRESQVAEINAARQVLVNEQNTRARTEDVKAAEQEARAVELRTTAEAAAKRRLLEADGALEQKLAAYVAVQKVYAEQFAKQKWTPEVVMGGTGSDNGNAAADMIQLLTVRGAQDLALDLQIAGQR